MNGDSRDGFQSAGRAPLPDAEARAEGDNTPGDVLPRLGARLIDILPFYILGWVLTAVVELGNVLPLIEGMVIYLYFVLLDTYVGTTVGKRLLHLRVTGPTGDRPEIKEAATREAFLVVGVIVGIVPVVGGALASILWIAVAVTISTSPTKQGKHDEIAGGTHVIRA